MTALAVHADKKSINSFHYWLLIFNYEAPCNFQRSQIPPIKQVLQVRAAPVGRQTYLQLTGPPASFLCMSASNGFRAAANHCRVCLDEACLNSEIPGLGPRDAWKRRAPSCRSTMAAQTCCQAP